MREAWPLGAFAQQPDRMRWIGVFLDFGAYDPVEQARVAAFRTALEQLGWADGQNVRIELRWGGYANLLRNYSTELVALTPDVIVAGASTTLASLLQATRTIPTVFTG